MGGTTVQRGTSRSKRGLDLYRQYGGRIKRTAEQGYTVPGCSAESYEADLAGETCNCPDFSNRSHGEGFYCKHMFAAMLFSIKHPAAEVIEQPTREPSRCAGCGVPSGKPSQGGSALSGKGPGQPLYCMDCNPAFAGTRADVAANLDRFADMAGVA